MSWHDNSPSEKVLYVIIWIMITAAFTIMPVAAIAFLVLVLKELIS